MKNVNALLGRPGDKALILGNEAIARGCVESGVKIATCYPGTPSSEITDTLVKISKKVGMYVEYSTNEKVALEVAAGAAISGVRSIASMKHVGLNVAADVLTTLAYTGVRAGCVVVSADDPECWSSQNEQDNRYYARLAGIPCLEPSNSQEAKDMTIEGFRLSEKLELPILLRTTTRINHSLSPVILGVVEEKESKKEFSKDAKRFVMIPSNALTRHEALLQKLEQAREISESSPFNSIIKEGKEIGIIASGVSVNYSLEAVDKLGLSTSILKLGLTYPLPSNLIQDFLQRFNKIFIIEELEPILENDIRSIALTTKKIPKILGKLTGHFPRNREYSTRIVMEAIAKEQYFDIPDNIKEGAKFRLPFDIPTRPPVLCPGCPHRASFYLMKTTLRPKTVYCTDIGCYALGVQPPLAIGDILVCMGASVGIACGISQVQNESVLSIVGDSTFFHAAVPGLINAVNNNHHIIVAVLDNLTTAMTGFQPHPGSIDPNRKGSYIAIEEVAKGCGIKYVKVIDPYNVQETRKIFKEAAAFPGPSLIVLRHLCSILEIKKDGRKKPLHIDGSLCTGCQACITAYGCPAMFVEQDKVKINSNLCSGCGFCIHICPYKAIKKT